MYDGQMERSRAEYGAMYDARVTCRRHQPSTITIDYPSTTFHVPPITTTTLAPQVSELQQELGRERERAAVSGRGAADGKARLQALLTRSFTCQHWEPTDCTSTY